MNKTILVQFSKR